LSRIFCIKKPGARRRVGSGGECCHPSLAVLNVSNLQRFVKRITSYFTHRLPRGKFQKKSFSVKQKHISVPYIYMKTNNKTLQQRATEQEAKRRADNARKARKTAEREFPGEKWKTVEDGIYLSPRRPIGKKSNYQDELRDAQILRDLGSTVYLVPEQSRHSGRKFDAIVNGLKMEFKNVGGNANTLIAHFLKSRSQAPNVFINLETSDLKKREVMSALYSARNSVTHTDEDGNIIKGYAERNGFPGGRIILKLKEQKNLVYLKVDDLKARR